MNKIIKILLIALTFLTVKIDAQPKAKTESINKITEINLIHSLNHDLDCIVESSLFNMLLLKNKYPEANLNVYIDEVQKIALENKSERIRYKAELALWYMKDQSKLGKLNITDKENQDKYFNELADLIQANLIASK